MVNCHLTNNFICSIFGHHFVQMNHVLSIVKISEDSARIAYECERCGGIGYEIIQLNFKEDKKMSNVKIQAPWYEYFAEVNALFKEDPDVNVTYDDSKYELKLYVNGVKKADALKQIFPEKKSFGNIVMKIMVIPANIKYEGNPISLFKDAFENNPAVVNIVSGDNPVTSTMNYIVFKKKVVQYFNDNLGDINGNMSTLYENIARDIFIDSNTNGIFFCTDNKDEK